MTTSARRHDLEITIDGDMFKINGSTTFIVFASYFDAIHTDLTIIDADFSALSGYGFKGVRIFPNWFRVDGPYDSSSNYRAQDTLFDKDGGLRSGTLNKLLEILDSAKANNLIVDLSFTAENVVDCPMDNCTSGTSALTYAEYKGAIEAITTELAGYGSAHKHVIFDLQNESNNNGPNDVSLDYSYIGDLAEAVHAIDPGRIVFSSRGDNVGPQAAAEFADLAEIDVAVLHESRACNWGNDSDYRVDTMEGQTDLPIYFQETARYRTDSGPQNTNDWFSTADLDKSLYNAKTAGAAAWNFHTRASMSLHYGNTDYGIFDDLQTVENNFITGLSSLLSCSGTCPTSDLSTCPSPRPTATVAPKRLVNLMTALRPSINARPHASWRSAFVK